MRYKITNDPFRETPHWKWYLYSDDEGADECLCESHAVFGTRRLALLDVKNVVKAIQAEAVFSSSGKFISDGKALKNYFWLEDPWLEDQRMRDLEEESE